MPVEFNSFNPLVSTLPVGENRQAERRQQLEEERNNRDNTQVQGLTSTNDQRSDQVRRAEAIEQVEQRAALVRRDDNSELSRSARQAIDRFSSINATNQPDPSEILGIDTFA
ncbi:MAG: hypothetical protein HWE27_18250 [Gammaproteobacteria bacterium]|nr:hypothetical protein [Gammaproteobacteria bacterium]